jgi:hypothetical protein
VAYRDKLLASKSKIEWLGIGTQSRPRGSGTNEKLRGTSAANMPIELGRRDDTNRAVPISYFSLYSPSRTDVSGANTILLAVQEGDIWRVQIVWPNGSVHYFGRFSSRKGAHEWIIRHAWLTAPVAKKNSARKDGPTAESGD